MYESFYGFKERPFSTLPDPDFLYMSKEHEMALTYLEYGLSSQAGFMVLTGEIGSGKTTLINYLINKTDNAATKIALIFNTNIRALDFLKSILEEWGVDCKQRRKAELYDVLNNFLLNEYRENTSVILIIDEAQNLPFETMEEIRMISNLNDEKVPLLHIILSGQPNLINRLNNPKLEQLCQRVSVHYHLDPLDKEESFLYTEHRLKTAGATDLDIFTPDALESIYMYSEGIPRVINLICDMALVYGYAEQIKPVDRSIIDMVVEDRRKMGLGFGSNSNFSGSVKPGRFNNSLDRTVSLEKKFQELNDNVSELALLVRKMIRNKDFVEKMDQKHQQEIEQLYQKVKGLEEKLSVSAYQKMIQNLMSKWTHAEADKENR
jgi:general secretion pathway protein A